MAGEDLEDVDFLSSKGAAIDEDEKEEGEGAGFRLMPFFAAEKG